MRKLFLERESQLRPELHGSTRILVVAPSRWKCAPDDRQIGWRITCKDGEPYDVMWGAMHGDRLDALVSELRDKHGAVDVLELATRDDLRDREYYARSS